MFYSYILAKMKFILFFISTFIFYEQLHSFVPCKTETYDACATASCVDEPTRCPKGQTIIYGGWCRCCRVCATILREGAKCPFDAYIGIGPPSRFCDEGLRCIQGVCTKV
ncbi:unnamed protein product [Brassicogethes aeneus]|uniref:IGFBP N-terminal domain-containing protein n=1 Tax=Brassicogethes aeneus TaxID=1431903 RepID=A0A9P0B5Q7_BRAAE|nr:unnamed protein product [Brassicogethes aeneus]